MPSTYVSPWIGLVWLPPDPAGQEAASDIINGERLRAARPEAKAGERLPRMFVAADDRAIDAVLHALQATRSWLSCNACGRDPLAVPEIRRVERSFSTTEERGLPDRLEDFTAIVSVASGHSQGPLLAITTRAMEEESRIDTLRSGGHVPSVGRNDLCPCGSGRKYKRCHGRWRLRRQGVTPRDGRAFDVAVNVAVKRPSDSPAEGLQEAHSEREIVVSPVGFEPTTRGLKVPCSAAELRARCPSNASVPGAYGRIETNVPSHGLLGPRES